MIQSGPNLLTEKKCWKVTLAHSAVKDVSTETDHTLTGTQFTRSSLKAMTVNVTAR